MYIGRMKEACDWILKGMGHWTVDEAKVTQVTQVRVTGIRSVLRSKLGPVQETGLGFIVAEASSATELNLWTGPYRCVHQSRSIGVQEPPDFSEFLIWLFQKSEINMDTLVKEKTHIFRIKLHSLNIREVKTSSGLERALMGRTRLGTSNRGEQQLPSSVTDLEISNFLTCLLRFQLI